jgi:hypothetical protein
VNSLSCGAAGFVPVCFIPGAPAAAAGAVAAWAAGGATGVAPIGPKVRASGIGGWGVGKAVTLFIGTGAVREIINPM